MARKRKKSHAKKQRIEPDPDVNTLNLDDDESEVDVAALVASLSGEDEHEVVEVDGDESEPPMTSLYDDGEGEVAAISIDDDAEVEVAVISIDDDDGAEGEVVREQLIAETLALAATEDSGLGVEAEPLTAEAAEARIVPLLTPAALLALSEMRHGDIGKLGAELVLDLGEGTTPEERDRILAAALAQVEMQEAIYRVPTDSGSADRGKSTIALVLMIMAVLVSVRPPALVIPDPPAQVGETDQIYGTRVALLLQVQQIEAYRIREQRLPESLEEVTVALPGVRFVKSSNRLYQLIAYTPGGIAIVYDSAAPTPDFERISRNWTTTRGAS